MRRIGEILESIVVVAILGALVHTFLEDISVLAGWTVTAREGIVWAGLGFDLFFTVEFFVRLYLALASRKGIEYFFRERGWIDFLASIPLLLFHSIPGALALLAGAGLSSGLGGFLNVLKVIKAVRIARILRLLRVIKLFRGIRYARSPLAQRHIALITTISVTFLVLSTFGASTLQGLGVLPGSEEALSDGQGLRARAIAEAKPGSPALEDRASAVASLDPTILLVRTQDGADVWSRYDAAYYTAHFLPGDYGFHAAHGVEIFVDERPRERTAARESVMFFAAVVLSLLGYLLLYAPRFALGISDPLYVMKRGMAESGYNLEVKIPADRTNDDVFELASLYNTVFLPLKDRDAAGKPAAGTSLRLDDVKDLVG